MTELLTTHNLEHIKPVDIFNIKNNTDTVISRIQGKDASPEITKTLISQGYSNYRCLSGGLIALSDYFEDDNLSQKLNQSVPIFGMSLRQRIIQETGKPQPEYYHSLKGKKLYIITHKIITNLYGTILEKKLEDIGVEKIECFQTTKSFYETFKREFDL